MTGNEKCILLVEDNEKIMSGNIRKFRREGYDVTAALTLAEARASLALHRPDAIVLDIMLPDGSGLEFIQELRASENAGIPVLLLTGLGAKEDIVQGLTSGGDDYLTKPYDFNELLARVGALLRRAERVPDVITKGRLTFDLTANVASLDGTDLLLAQKEFALLLIFAQNPERFFSTEYLYEKVWKTPIPSDSSALRSTIKRLRSKIEGCGWCIGWLRNEGYIFEKS
jgi:DNA-binding response OmpR family regulator